MPADRILVTEDDAHTQAMLQVILSAEGFAVDSAETGMSALDMASRSNYDLVILDLILPDMSGLQVCERLRKGSDVPVIMLTGCTGTADKVVGLNLGADDYVEKPFEPGELLARMRALLRRYRKGNDAKPRRGPLRVCGLRLDPDSYEVAVEGQAVGLTRLEFDLLYCLADSAGKVLSRQDIVRRVWGEEEVIDLRGIDAHIRRLRTKVETSPDRPQRILSIYGVGYKMPVDL
ncbi:MAG TPA: response regulator transcription factor [Armatimonadota bacterium]|jgi:DNA-binding response OmpR family regulator